MLETILLSLLIMSASLSGVFFLWKSAENFIEKNLRYLVSLSAGVFLFVTYLLMAEVFEHTTNLYQASTWIIAGVLLMIFLFTFLPRFHHHHDEKEEHGHTHDKIDARKILLSDGIHNIGDGILLAAAVMVSPVFGLLTALSIFVHEFVQEVSEFFVLRQSGYSTKKALALNFFVSGTILIGAIGSFLLFETFEFLEVPLLGIAAGSFLVVVVNDLIPQSIRHSNNKTNFAKHFTAFLVGIALIFTVSQLTTHSHEDHDHGHEEEHEHELHEDEHEEDKDHHHE
jgi:zinc and cadmium transporter